MREIVHMQAGQCGNQIGAKVSCLSLTLRKNFKSLAGKAEDIQLQFRFCLKELRLSLSLRLGLR